MGQQIYKIARITDKQIAEALNTIATEFGSFAPHVGILDLGIGQITFPNPSDETFVRALEKDADLINHFSASSLNVNFSYYRGGNHAEAWRKSPTLDDLAVELRSNEERCISFAARLLELFRPVQLPDSVGPLDLLDAQRALQEATFGRLERQLEQVFQQTIDLRAQLDERARQKEEALEAQFQQKKEQADADIQAQKEGLEQEKAELDLRRKALDDSDNTFARRQIRDRMLTDVQNRMQQFGVSQTTVRSRWPVAAGMAVLIAFLLGAFAWTTTELINQRSAMIKFTELASRPNATTPPEGTAPEKEMALKAEAARQAAERDAAKAELQALSSERIALWIRLALTSFGFAASLIYYIRWQNQWAQQFAQTELALQQFQIDINRANWVVETCLEWRKETQSDIPTPLIESMTKGLFKDKEAVAQVLHPADELASALMGTASKLTLNVGGNTVEIDKPKNIPKTVSTAG